MTLKTSTSSLAKKQNQLTNQAIRYLAIRPRSQAEIHSYLERKTSNQQLVDAVVATLNDLKLIDDANFSHWFISSRLHQKPRGSIMIRYELKHLGVDQTTINSAISQISFNDWQQAAISLLQKHNYKLTKLAPQKLKAKAYNYLYSKGFPGEIITAAIDEFVG